MQPVHSGVHTEGFSWTRISTGHPRVHARQSMHASRSRTTRCGDAKLTSPRSAPYGHRYRHQKFFTTTDSRTRTARVTAVVTLISVKKRSILASAAWLYVPRWNFMIAIASIIHATAHRKKARRKYFREASAWSAQAGTRTSFLRRFQRVISPTHESAREIPPTGQTQEQRTFRARKAETSAAIRMVRPAGC